jgi:colicin import membrane protein
MRVYAQIVEQRIKSHWRFPRLGIQKNLQAVVEVKIDAQGKIIDTSLVSGSGRSDFDNSVLRAVEETGELSVPPGKEIKSIKFTFNLQEQR